jgi:hypothetical protein
MRSAAAALLAALALHAGVTGAGAQGDQETTPGTTTPRDVALTAPDGEVKRDLGEHRDARTVTLLLDAAETLTSAPAVGLTDATTTNGKPFDGTITATADLVGGKAVRVPVVVDPADAAKPGTYNLTVRLRGPEIASEDVPLALTLSRSPGSGAALALALLALVIGLALGGLLKWFADRGTKLRELLQRAAVLGAALRDVGRTPQALGRSLSRMRLMLAQGNAAGAETELNALEGGLPKLLPALDRLRRTAAVFPVQEVLIPAMGADAALVLRLTRVVTIERQKLEEQIDDAWPAPDDNKDAREALLQQFNGFTAFLNHYKHPDARAGASAAKFETALAAYEAGNFIEAHNAWKPPAAQGTESGPTAQGEQALDLPAASTMSQFQWWLAMRSPGAVGLLAAIALALVGLYTIFEPDTMFLTDDVGDFLLLILWGFGTALTGVTVTQLAAKATTAITPG